MFPDTSASHSSQLCVVIIFEYEEAKHKAVVGHLLESRRQVLIAKPGTAFPSGALIAAMMSSLSAHHI